MAAILCVFAFEFTILLQRRGGEAQSYKPVRERGQATGDSMSPTGMVAHSEFIRAIGKPNRAFTLVEIMLVVAIIGLLLAIAIPSFVKARTETLTNLCIENMRVILHASHLYEIETGTPLTGGTNGVFLRNTLINGGYVRKRMTFECPISGFYDYDDYTLSYTGDKLTGIRCTMLPAEHILP